MTPGTSPTVELVLTVDGREYRREMGGADQLLNRYGQTAVSTNAKVSLLTAGIGRMFGAFSAAAAAGYIVRTAKEFEALNAQLLTVEKSEPRARLAFQRIQEFAASTPYQLQEVVEAFIKLRNLGLDPSEEALTAYGNTASSMGKSLNQMIEAVADASVGEFERLKEFGIKARSEGDQVTFTFRGVATTVKKSSEEIQRYLMQIGATEFAGGMQRQVATLDGVFSNFGDSVAALATRVDSGTGLTGALKEAVKWSTALINELAGVSRSIPDIEADLERARRKGGSSASSLLKHGAGATTGPIGMLRAGISLWQNSKQNDVEGLQDELLNAQLTSTDPKVLAAGVDELEARIQTASKRVRSLGQAHELTALRELERRQKEAQLRLSEIEQADAAAEAEKKAAQTRDTSTSATDKAIKAQEKLQETIDRSLRDRELEIRLHGDASEAAKVRAEIELGFYKDWTPAQRERLLQLATEKDAITDLTRAAEKEADARKAMREGSKDLVEQLGPKATGKRFKRDVKNARPWEIDAVEDAALGNEQARFESQMQDLQKHREDLLAMGADYNAMEQEAWAQHEAEKTRITREAGEARTQLMQEQAQVASDIFGDLASVAQLFGKDGFKAYKAFSIAQATASMIAGAIGAFSRASEAYPPPFGQIAGAAAAAAVVATNIGKIAQIKAMTYEGREWGGSVMPGRGYRVGERGRPELLEQDGKFFLLPGERGGKVSPAKAAPLSGGGGNVVIHNYAGVNVTARRLSDGDIEVMVAQAAETGAAMAEQRIAGGIRNGRSPVAGAIGSKFGVQGRPDR